MDRWSYQDIERLTWEDLRSPDISHLAKPRRWSEAGACGPVVWGICRGSGKKPYRVIAQTNTQEWYCSCSSRKSPCKHTLALLLLWSQGQPVPKQETVAEFVTEWRKKQEQKAQREARKTARERDGATPAESVAKNRRITKRMQETDDGLEECARWLHDVAHMGVAAAAEQPDSFVEDAATRLVDAHCPVLADDIRALPMWWNADTPHRDEVGRLLGRCWTVIQMWRRRDELSEDEVADVRSALGWSWPTEEIRRRPHLADRWQVLGIRKEKTSRVWQRRAWLRSLTQSLTVVVIDHAPRPDGIPWIPEPGAVMAATVALYPGTAPRRALLVDDWTLDGSAALPQAEPLDTSAAAVAGHLAANPLALRTPVLLDGVTLSLRGARLEDGGVLPWAQTLTETHVPWKGLSVAGSQPCTCFAEWTGRGLVPLTVAVDEEMVACD